IGTVVAQLHRLLAAHPVMVYCPPDLPLVWLDFARIDQVLTNLLENAAKYTPPGTSITIDGQATAVGVVVCVCDAGPGPAPDAAGALFTPFTPHPVPGQPLGTGLGLSIAHGIIAAHGGQITTTRPPDGGWCVAFTLPPGPTAGEPPRAGAPAAADTRRADA
ncbi:MAG TPA: ATP-binding protein, partial [Chloroflexia bacterium]|nr:ATP-binding protein [Chloroflexia bacterium]